MTRFGFCMIVLGVFQLKKKVLFTSTVKVCQKYVFKCR